MAHFAKINFVRQQGFCEADAPACEMQYPALMFQPRLIGILVAIALVFQAWPLFLLLSAILWWNVVVPSQNLFDILYNHFVAARTGRPPLTPTPAPRRFAQGMAGTFMLGIGVFLLLEWNLAAWILEGLLIVALVALIFGKFCLGSYIYHAIRGDAAFANRTLPWTDDQLSKASSR